VRSCRFTRPSSSCMATCTCTRLARASRSTQSATLMARSSYTLHLKKPAHWGKAWHKKHGGPKPLKVQPRHLMHVAQLHTTTLSQTSSQTLATCISSAQMAWGFARVLPVVQRKICPGFMSHVIDIEHTEKGV
jgi:hypothetical protein